MSRNNTPTTFERLEDRRLFALPAGLGGSERSAIDFTQDWKFTRSDASGGQNIGRSTKSWETVDLPHTFNAQDGQDGEATPSSNTIGDYYRGGTWYRKSFKASSSWDNKRIFINVEAASIRADVYVNGQFVSTHKGAYAGFTADITSFYQKGKDNLVAIRVDNSLDSSLPGFYGDWTSFGGLTRGVTLYATDVRHVNSASLGASGVKISQDDVSTDRADLGINVALRNDDSKTANLSVRTSIVDAKGKLRSQVKTNVSLAKRKSGSVNQSLTVERPHLWNGTKDPYQYTAYIQVMSGNSVIDTMVEKVGIRSFETTADGAKLNGTSVQLRGANLHDDWANKGSATSLADKRKDLQLLKDMGANAVRFAHWQVDEDYYDLADEMGLMVYTEIPIWRRVTQSQAFIDNSKLALQELIRQNYNHASIVYWGLYNELVNYSQNDGYSYDINWATSLIGELNTLAHAEDPTRKTIGASELDYGNTSIATSTDVTTFNKYFGWYNNYGQSTDARLDQFGTWLASQANAQPGRALGMGEYGAGANVEHHVNDPENAAPTSDPNSLQFQSEEYQAYFHQRYWETIEASPNPVFSAFIWQLTDSANDNRNEGDLPGINTKGLVTHDRATLKDAYYYYKSQWNSSPMIHLTSKRFTDRTEADTTVKAYSNLGTSAELFINGDSQGTASPVNGILTWDVSLEGGENDVEVRSAKSGTTYKSSATWNLAVSARASAYVEAAAIAAIATTRTSRASDLFADDSAIV